MFTGCRSSSFGSVSENPPPRQAVRQRKRCLGRPREGARGLPGAFLGTFCAHKKYPQGPGLRKPRAIEKKNEALRRAAAQSRKDSHAGP